MSQSESVTEIAAPQVVPTAQVDNDAIDYASSMTSAYQHDELDEGNSLYWTTEMLEENLNSRYGCRFSPTRI